MNASSAPRLLILTAGFGEGHNAAARALHSAWIGRHGEQSAVIADVFDQANPLLNRFARTGYLTLINRMPRVWSRMYAFLDKTAASFGAIARTLVLEKKVLASLLRENRPDIVCSTYPVYAFLMEEAARLAGVRLPHFNIVTDSISINALWWKAGASGWFMPNEDSAEVIRRAGVNPRLVFVDGFPVAPGFADRVGELEPPDLATGVRPRVLVIIHSGTRAVETARRLLLETDWEVTCAVGRDEKLRRELEGMAARRAVPAQVFGWTPNMPELLRSHHVVVSKAGGATTQEAIAARCPMIVTQIVPGQEEGNYELLRRHGIGAYAPHSEAVLQRLRAAFARDGVLWSKWRDALEPLARPDAADRIASRLAHLVRRTSPVAV
jgi:processive 1,2-diacylglycerol beta-glucosyltransferase